MKTIIISLSLLALFSVNSIAQPPNILWTQTYGGSSWDEAYNGQLTTDGGYILVGGTHSFGAGNSDVYLVKTNASGDTLWTSTYGGVGSDYGLSVYQTLDGGYILTGATDSFGAGGDDVYVVKTDASGNATWTQTYGGSSGDYGWSVRQTLDGGYIIAAQTASFGAGMADFYLVKTDASGNISWARTYGGSSGDWPYCVQQTQDGGYIVTGETESFGAGNNDIYLIKTDASGDTAWTRTFGGIYYEIGWCVQQVQDGGYVIVGDTYSFGSGSYDLYLIKTNANGNASWTQTFGGGLSDYGYWVEQLPDGGYILTGITGSFGAGAHDGYIVRTDSYGNELWTQTVGGTETENTFNVQQTPDGGYFVGGYTYSYGAGESDLYLVRLESDPVPVEPQKDLSGDIPTEFSLQSPYPNPFNPVTTFRVELPVASWVTIGVYDIAGRPAGSPLQRGWMPAGYHEVTFNASGLASGVYVYRLEAGEFSTSGKMVLMK
jgi:hypothetical protein